MNSYEFVWTERHTVKVDAKTLEEAQVMMDASEPEETRQETYDRSVTTKCAYHRVLVNDDYPCEQCLQDAAEEGEADYRREA